MKKKGQMFIFAAVVISAIIISLSGVKNAAVIAPEPRDINDIAKLVKRESGKVIDYEIYSQAGSNKKLEPFLNNLSRAIREKDPNANFLIIFGNNQNAEIRNYGSEGVKTCTNSGCTYQKGANSKIISKIKSGNLFKKVTGTYSNTGDFWKETIKNQNEIRIEVRGQEFKFSLDENRKVIFVIQKDSKDGSYISVK